MASILNLATCLLLAVVLQLEGANAVLKCHQAGAYALLATKKETALLPTADECHLSIYKQTCDLTGFLDEGKTTTPVCIRLRYETGNAELMCGVEGQCKRSYGYAPDEKDKTKGLSKRVKTCEECKEDYCFKDGATSVAANLVLSMISLSVVYFAKRMA